MNVPNIIAPELIQSTDFGKCVPDRFCTFSVLVVSKEKQLPSRDHRHVSIVDTSYLGSFFLNNGYVEGSFITFLEPVGASPDPKSVVRNLVAPRTGSCVARPKKP